MYEVPQNSVVNYYCENKNNRTMGHIANLRKSSNQLHHETSPKNALCQDCSVVEIGPVIRSRDEI